MLPWLLFACSGGEDDTRPPRPTDREPTADTGASPTGEGGCEGPVAELGVPLQLSLSQPEEPVEGTCLERRDASAVFTFTPPASGTYLMSYGDPSWFWSTFAVFSCDGEELSCTSDDLLQLQGGKAVDILVQNALGDGGLLELTVLEATRNERGLCDDGVNNDGDFDLDCDEPECADDPACGEVCDDGRDDNQNGLIDCDDASCRDAANCQFQCPTAVWSGVPGTAQASLIGAPNRYFSNDCQGQGPEQFWEFTAPSDGTFTFDTVGTPCPTDISLLRSCELRSAFACANSGSGGDDDSASISADLTAGETLYVVVEADRNDQMCDYVLNVR